MSSKTLCESRCLQRLLNFDQHLFVHPMCTTVCVIGTQIGEVGSCKHARFDAPTRTWNALSGRLDTEATLPLKLAATLNRDLSPQNDAGNSLSARATMRLGRFL